MFAFLVLTLITQIGGLVLLAHCSLIRRFSLFKTPNSPLRNYGSQNYGSQMGVFTGLYLLITCLIVPYTAPRLSHRRPLPCFGTQSPIKPVNPVYCLLNRHYVDSGIYEQLLRLAADIKTKTGAPLQYLDASFPYINHFPLLPHLSHKDGRNIDFAFFYRDKTTKQSSTMTPSPIGYFGYVSQGKFAQEPARWLDLRWDFEWLQPILARRPIELDRTRTQYALKRFAIHPLVQKILLEPPLGRHLGLQHGKFRYQGPRAARHDDHFHVRF